MDSFETRLHRLETIGEELKSGEVELNRAAELFQEGMKLAGTLDGELRRIEKRIEILVNAPNDEDETPILELFPELDRGESTE